MQLDDSPIEKKNQDEKIPLSQRIDWPTSLFLIVTPLLAATLTPIYVVAHALTWPLIALFVIFAGMTNLSITAGYHRYLSHQSYQASRLVRLFYLLVGAAAFQGSALKWCSDHRRHHRFVDTEQDPYNIQRGFFYAHIGWLFLKDDPHHKNDFAPDLAKDPMIMFQHKHYYLIASFMSFVLPMLVGYFMGSMWGGLIFGGILRVVITHHTTFLINSFCHMFGKQTYGTKNSAKDSFIMSVFTHGEGYHNFHHHFQADYRNGVRWFDWDPTKWFILSLGILGGARKLKRVSHFEIIRARIQEEERQLLRKGVSNEMIEPIRTRLEESLHRWQQLKADYQSKKREYIILRDKMAESSHARLKQIRFEMKQARREFKTHLREWSYQLKYSQIAMVA